MGGDCLRRISRDQGGHPQAFGLMASASTSRSNDHDLSVRWRPPKVDEEVMTTIRSNQSSKDDESAPRVGLDGERQAMREEASGRRDPVGPRDWWRTLPIKLGASSDLLGWVGLEAVRCAQPDFESEVPALTHHRLVLVSRPPEQLELRYDGVKRSVPHRPGP